MQAFNKLALIEGLVEGSLEGSLEGSVVKVIYHGGQCPDGFGSAWAAWMYFRARAEVIAGQVSVEYIAANHGDEAPDCAGAIVFLLDFSWRRPVLIELLKKARHVVILDHHLSAAKDLEGLATEFSNLDLVFDMRRSGAVITWQYFHQRPVPTLLCYVQDRDLWQFALPDSRDVTAAIMSYPFGFELWRQWHEEGGAVVGDTEAGDTVADGPEDSAIRLLAREGKTINRFRRQMIEYYKTRAFTGIIAGFTVPIVNSPLVINSELLNELANGAPFAAGYSDKGDKRFWSLRSSENGADVSAIAFRFGGGGHPRAAGFSTTLKQNLLPLEP
jgi:oligoribonuclease NrnB/cAMP/cGMP phosphodiesterase (DHH superfamily)